MCIVLSPFLDFLCGHHFISVTQIFHRRWTRENDLKQNAVVADSHPPLKSILRLLIYSGFNHFFLLSNGNRILKHLSSTPHETSNTLYKFLYCTVDILVRNMYCTFWLKTWTESYANDLPVTDKTFWKVLCIFNHIYLRISCGIYLSIGKKMKQEFYRYICIDKNTVLKIWKLH